MSPDELIDLVFSSALISDALCRERLGGGKLSADAARRYLELPLRYRPDVSIFFDSEYYYQKYPDIDPAGIDPLLHFFACGFAEGRAPHPLVDPVHIRSMDKHLLPSGCGIHELYEVLLFNLANPSPYFVLDYYQSYLTPVEDASEGLLAHFLTHGLKQGFKPNPLFDPLWYAAHGLNEPTDVYPALRQFVMQGDLEGRAPSLAFSGKRYLQRYRDVADAALPPLAHYLTVGQTEGRDCLPEQDNAAQLETMIKSRLDAAAGSVDSNDVVATYSSLRGRIDTFRQEEKERVSVVGPGLTQYKELAKNIAKLGFPRAKDPRISILVPVFNEVPYTVECLASIIAAKARVSFEVVVADDASTDPSIELLAKIKNIKVVRQPTNVGFLENCNRAYRACKGEFLLLLNNDAQLMPGCLDAMLDVLDNVPDAAAVGPKILYPDGRLQEAGCTLDRDGISTMVGLFADPGLPQYNYTRDVHYCSGAALMVRRTDVGDALFDDRFKPAYCEDADLCLRLLAQGKRVIYCPQAEVVHHLSVSTNRQSVIRRLQTVTRNQQKLTEKWAGLLADINTTRVIAFYLPQFHPTPENDFHWGQGFTEWTNVAKATPGYAGHYQPHLPADLGFYDLRVRQTVERQAALAQRYGIDGFCVYYYRFGRQRALDQAFEAIVADPSLPFPYCVCWANENWTRHWDGGSREIIFEQQYDRETLLSVVGDAVRYAADPRYIRVNRSPLFLVYRPLLIPDPHEFATLVRDAFRKAGHPGVHLAYIESMETAARGLPPAHIGFDACVEFPPHGTSVKDAEPATIIRDDFIGTRYDYEASVLEHVSRPLAGYKRYPGVFPSWDNTPRQSQRGDSFVRATPEAFQVYVEEKLEYVRQFLVGEERLLFVNAWNEWAEGTHLEPDQKFGHRWLEAIRNARLAKCLA